MRKLLILLFTSLLLAACSSTKELQFTSLNQQQCTNETTLNSPGEFTGETVGGMDVYKQGESVYVSMDIRTYCNARIVFDLAQKGNQILLKLRNAMNEKDNCVCVKNVTTSFKNLSPGTYDIMVTDAGGYTVLDHKVYTLK